MKNIWSIPTIASVAISALALLGAAPHGRTIVQPPHIIAPAPPVSQPRPPYIIAPQRPATAPANGARPATKSTAAQPHVPVDPKPVQPAVSPPQ